MPKKNTKKALNRKIVPSEKVKPDQSTDRPILKDDEFIAKIPKINLTMSREQRAVDMHNRGLPLASIMASCGFPPQRLFAVLGLDVAMHARELEHLYERYNQTRLGNNAIK